MVFFLTEKNNILPNVAEKICHVVPRRHGYSYSMNKIMSMILPYGSRDLLSLNVLWVEDIV